MTHFIYLKTKNLNGIAFTKLLRFLVKSPKVSFASSIIKNIVVFPALSQIAVKLIC